MKYKFLFEHILIENLINRRTAQVGVVSFGRDAPERTSPEYTKKSPNIRLWSKDKKYIRITICIKLTFKEVVQKVSVNLLILLNTFSFWIHRNIGDFLVYSGEVLSGASFPNDTILPAAVRLLIKFSIKICFK